MRNQYIKVVLYIVYYNEKIFEKVIGKVDLISKNCYT